MTYLPHFETDKTRKPFLSKALIAELALFWAAECTKFLILIITPSLLIVISRNIVAAFVEKADGILGIFSL
jgi:hypothetical protein